MAQSDVEWAGDFNGDGQWDIVMGEASYQVSTDPQTSYWPEGLVRIVSGDGQELFADHGPNQSSLGKIVNTANDVDGDGLWDVMATFEGPTGRGVRVYFGRSSSATTVETVDIHLPAQPSDDDHLVALGGGRLCFVSPGNPSISKPGEVFFYKYEEPTPGVRDFTHIHTESRFDVEFGKSILSLDSMGTSGLGLVVIGSPRASSATLTQCGRIEIFEWTAFDQVFLRTTVHGTQPNWGLGSMVSYYRGDWNKDGFADILVKEGVARVSIVSGKDILHRSPNAAVLHQFNFFNWGYSWVNPTAMEGCGDISGDGVPDILFGTNYAQGGGTANGWDLKVVSIRLGPQVLHTFGLDCDPSEPAQVEWFQPRIVNDLDGDGWWEFAALRRLPWPSSPTCAEVGTYVFSTAPCVTQIPQGFPTWPSTAAAPMLTVDHQESDVAFQSLPSLRVTGAEPLATGMIRLFIDGATAPGAHLGVATGTGTLRFGRALTFSTDGHGEARITLPLPGLARVVGGASITAQGIVYTRDGELQQTNSVEL